MSLEALTESLFLLSLEVANRNRFFRSMNLSWEEENCPLSMGIGLCNVDKVEGKLLEKKLR
jgi:hypothetical protein